jgi:hypothetical protein
MASFGYPAEMICSWSSQHSLCSLPLANPVPASSQSMHNSLSRQADAMSLCIKAENPLVTGLRSVGQ